METSNELPDWDLSEKYKVNVRMDKVHHSDRFARRVVGLQSRLYPVTKRRLG